MSCGARGPRQVEKVLPLREGQHGAEGRAVVQAWAPAEAEAEAEDAGPPPRQGQHGAEQRLGCLPRGGAETPCRGRGQAWGAFEGRGRGGAAGDLHMRCAWI